MTRDDEPFCIEDFLMRVLVFLCCIMLAMSLAFASDMQQEEARLRESREKSDAIIASYTKPPDPIESMIASIAPSPFDEIRTRLDQIESDIRSIKDVIRPPFGTVATIAESLLYPVYRTDHMPGCSFTFEPIKNPIAHVATYTY